MSTHITFRAGQKVFWLSNKGFMQGWIKRIQFSQDYHPKNKKVTTEFKYFLTCERYADVYMGDDVKEEHIFLTYKKMVEYYSKQKLS